MAQMTATVQRTGISQVDVGLQLLLTVISIAASAIAFVVLLNTLSQPTVASE